MAFIGDDAGHAHYQPPRANEKQAAAICRDSGPEMRTIATAAMPGGVAIAAIVSPV